MRTHSRKRLLNSFVSVSVTIGFAGCSSKHQPLHDQPNTTGQSAGPELNRKPAGGEDAPFVPRDPNDHSPRPTGPEATAPRRVDTSNLKVPRGSSPKPAGPTSAPPEWQEDALALDKACPGVRLDNVPFDTQNRISLNDVILRPQHKDQFGKFFSSVAMWPPQNPQVFYDQRMLRPWVGSQMRVGAFGLTNTLIAAMRASPAFGRAFEYAENTELSPQPLLSASPEVHADARHAYALAGFLATLQNVRNPACADAVLGFEISRFFGAETGPRGAENAQHLQNVRNLFRIAGQERAAGILQNQHDELHKTFVETNRKIESLENEQNRQSRRSKESGVSRRRVVDAIWGGLKTSVSGVRTCREIFRRWNEYNITEESTLQLVKDDLADCEQLFNDKEEELENRRAAAMEGKGTIRQRELSDLTILENNLKKDGKTFDLVKESLAAKVLKLEEEVKKYAELRGDNGLPQEMRDQLEDLRRKRAEIADPYFVRALYLGVLPSRSR